MKRFLKLFVVIFIIMTIGDMIKYEIGLWAKTAFYGAGILFYAFLLFNNIVSDIEINEKYRNHEIVKVRNRNIAKELFGLGTASLIIAVVLYFNDSAYWLLLLVLVIFLLWIHGRQDDEEFWMQIPNEDRPKKYQDDKQPWIY
ncbi:MAG: hypothetical protein II239_07735 [Peptococcaceae bacterium]|nr:hypothetical protein [Peptococcaceae bacterium]